MSAEVPFHRVSLTGRELEYVAEAARSGQIGGDGEFTFRCQELLERETGAARALLTTSCTHALELAALLVDLAPGDEVIVPSFTFVSSANAFLVRGARIVFADVRPDTLNLDERRLASLVTERTRAVVAVHYAGVACEMDAIRDVTAPRGIRIVEDNAHGLLGRYKGCPLGSLGDAAALSFHETKNFTCGEGGALLVNEPAWATRAEVLREKGTNRSRFLRGEVDLYSWIDAGSSYLPADILAAFLLAQLEARDAVQARRHALWGRYAEGLAPWAAERGAALPTVPAHCEHPAHLFHLLAPTADARRALIEHLRARGVPAAFHFLPLHLSPKGRALGGAPGQCPVSEDAAARLVRLPFHHGLSDDEQERVLEAVRSFPA